MNWHDKKKKENISADEWKIVEERLKTMPNQMRLGILSQSFDKEQLLAEVKKKSEIGRAYVEMQMEFITWLVKQSKVNQ